MMTGLRGACGVLCLILCAMLYAGNSVVATLYSATNSGVLTYTHLSIKNVTQCA